MIRLNSILVATDLTVECDGVLQTASTLARQAVAELHIVHVASEWDRDDPGPLQALHQQVARVIDPADAKTIEVRNDRPFHGILVHATDVHADLVVLGVSRATAVTSRMQRTTAERIVDSSEVPCLVVRSPITGPLNQYGVLLDDAVSDRGLIDVLADWAPRLGTAPEVTLVNTGPREARSHLNEESGHGFAASDPFGPIRRRAESMLPASVALSTARVSGPDASYALMDWARIASIQCLVATTTARTGFDRLWNGSRAARLTADAPCSVLLVPSAFWRRESIALETLAVAIDDTLRDGASKRWIESRIEHARQPLRQVDLDPHGDVVEAAWTSGADLIVLGDEREAGDAATPVSEHIESVLTHTPIPVLILRDLPDGPIDEVLVAVDTGELWYEKFGWAKRLHDRFGAHITVFHAIDLSAGSRVRRTPGGEFVPAISTWMNDDVERTVVPAMHAWIWERVRLAELPEEYVDVKVSMTDPWYAIPTLALTTGADLVVTAAHSAPGPDPAPLSPIAKAVLTGGTYSVLAVVDRERAAARLTREHLEEHGLV